MAIEPISQFFSALGRYPGNNKQWWVAKAIADDPTKGVKNGDFLPSVLDAFYSGNNKAPRGHFVINGFNRDRSAVSGIADIAAVKSTSRPTAVAFFSGRVWWAGNSEVFYSQILTDKTKAGLCYQEADPTSENISDLIASDGGNIPIPESTKILKLSPLANGMVVFATNGVWFVSGGSNGFSATSIAVDKVSSFGTSNPRATVQVDDTIYWWSEVGIHALQQSNGQFGPIPGKFGNTNIAEQTIQSYYNAIPDKCKNYAKGIYDPKNNIIQWLYSADQNDPGNLTKIIVYDITLQAFYPWQIGTTVTSPRVTGVALDTDILANSIAEAVTASSGTVTSNDLTTVTVGVQRTSIANRPTNLSYTVVSGVNLTYSKFFNKNFVDWVSVDGIGIPYLSFIETGFELNNDAMRRKQAVYVTIFFRRTADDSQGVPSSCRFKAKWDWSANSNSNKWSTEIEAYRPRAIIKPTSADLTSGFPVVFSKNKVRGSGKSVQFRFELGDAGKNFDLLGWSVSYAGNTKP